MDDTDIKKLEHQFLVTDAQYMAQCQVIDNLRSENQHLRCIIELLITNQKSV